MPVGLLSPLVIAILARLGIGARYYIHGSEPHPFPVEPVLLGQSADLLLGGVPFSPKDYIEARTDMARAAP